jgi:TolA-binding protein
VKLTFCSAIFSAFFLLTNLTFAQETPATDIHFQEKSALVGVPFRIQLFSENPDELYIVSECDFSLLSNMPALSQDGKSNADTNAGISPVDDRNREFLFKPIAPGVCLLSIDRVLPNRVDKHYLYYRITILPEAKQEQIQKAIAKKKAETKKDNDEELLQFQLIKQLFAGRLFDSANKEIAAYLKKFPAGAYLSQLAKIKADILVFQTNYAGAVKVYQDFQKKDDLKTEQRAAAAFEMAKVQLSNQDKVGASESLMRITTLYRDSPLYPDALLEAGKMMCGMKRFDAAMLYYQNFLDFYKDKPQTTPPPRMDEALYGMGQVYELDSTHRDMTKAAGFYESLLQTTPYSPLVVEAKKRLRYIDQNFNRLK